jgi:HSP20 family protein
MTAELPGLEKNDFTIIVEGKRLVLRGEKKMFHEDRGSHNCFSECSYGSFARAIKLPCKVDAEKAKAKYKHGVLRIELPKTSAAKGARIRVRAG